MSRLLFGLIASILIAPSLLAADATPVERKTNDRHIIDLLATIHDRGKDLFNAGDHAGCFRFFQGSLATVKLILPKELQETIDQGLGRAIQEPDFARRALVLHEVIEEVRRKLHPTAGPIEKLGPPRKATSDSDGVPKAPDEPLKIPAGVAETVEPPKAPSAAPKPKNDPAPPPPPPIIQATPTNNPKPTKPMPPPDAPDTLTVPPRPATPMAAPPSQLPPPVTPAGLPELAPLPPPMSPPAPPTKSGEKGNIPPPLIAPEK